MATSHSLDPQKILDSAPDAMIVVESDGRIALINNQTEQLFGYTRDDLLGQPLDVLIPERYRATHGKHVLRYFVNPATRAMGSGLALYGRRRDGSEMAIEVSLSPVQTTRGVLVSAAIRDITERKRIESLAKINAERLASAVESIQDAFALFDAEDRLLLCNSTYRQLVGRAVPGPLLGLPYSSLLDAWLSRIAFDSDEERAKFSEARRRQHRERESTYDFRTIEGESYRVTSRRTPEGGVVETVWDVTDDMRRAEELREARVLAEAGSAAKSEFLSSMSHELRTPLNAILGFAQLLKRDKKEPLSARHVERVDHILKGGEHLLRLIDDILDLSRIEAGGISISTEPVEVGEVLGEVQASLEPMAESTGVRLGAERLPNEVHVMAVDRTRVVQILMNLGSNAIKYNREGGSVTFQVSSPRDGVIRIAVIDTGYGIPLDKQAKLFQPFQRAGQETGPIEGTGIGLVITRRLAELMGGAVGFRSTPGAGSEFWVEVPGHASGRPEAPQPFSPPQRRVELGAIQKRLLYVEDNPANVVFMKDLLSVFDNLELIVATTAEKGVELAIEHLPEVIIMDINLPGMSGLDALGLLRGTAETQHIPVIALTAAASERDRQRGEKAGFYRYLTKPVRVDELEAALAALIAGEARSSLPPAQ